MWHFLAWIILIAINSCIRWDSCKYDYTLFHKTTLYPWRPVLDSEGLDLPQNGAVGLGFDVILDLFPSAFLLGCFT